MKICKLCGEVRNLQKSHAIGNSFFRKIFRKFDGKAIVLESNSNTSKPSSDSWSQYQLCRDCEQLLNNKFEKYAVSVLNGKNNEIKVTKSAVGVFFNNVDVARIIKYILSIYWRGALSSHDSYSRLIISNRISDNLRGVFLKDFPLLDQCYHVKIYRLINSNFENKYDTKDLICSPFYRLIKSDKHEKFNRVVYCFLFGGFFFEITLGRVSYKEKLENKFLLKNKNHIFMSYLDMNDIPEIKRNLDYWATYGNHNYLNN